MTVLSRGQHSGIGDASRHTAYRPDIDGLRAIAVLSVVIYHYGGAWLVGGGFAGVDIFFVISGYLITAIYAPQILAGTFTFRNFYTRRIRRILPALLVVLIATGIAGYFALWPNAYVRLAESSLAALFGLSNLYFYLNSGYFDPASNELPFLHSWSLGVEEQFYLVWPLLLVGVAALAGRTKARLALTAAGVLVISFLASLVALRSDPLAAFYLPHHRAWELALGGVVALLPAAPVRYREAASFTGIALTLGSVMLLSSDNAFPGWNALPPCAGAGLLIWANTGGGAPPLASRLLALWPMRAVGRISYSLYLWHWPVVVLYRQYVGAEDLSLSTTLGLAGISLVLSIATFVFVEQPFQGKSAMWRVPGRLLPVTLGLPVLASLALSGIVVAEKDFVGRIDDRIAGLLEFGRYDFATPFRSGTCFIDAHQDLPTEPASECLPDDGRPLAVLWGSSHAAMYYHGLVQPLAERGFATGQLTASGCWAIVGLDMPNRPNCKAFNDMALAAILRRHPSIVIMAGPLRARDQRVLLRNRALLKETVQRLQAAGIKVAILGFRGHFKQQVQLILAGRARVQDPNRFSLPEQFQGGEAVFNGVEKSTENWVRTELSATYLRILDVLCPDQKCELADASGTPLYAGYDHLTTTGSAKIGPALAEQIVAAAR